MTQRRNRPRHAMYVKLLDFLQFPRTKSTLVTVLPLVRKRLPVALLVEWKAFWFVRILQRKAALLMFVVKLKPLEGAENDGARGFFKGIGKGLVG